MKSGSLSLLEPSGPVQTCTANAVPLPLLLCYIIHNFCVVLIIFVSLYVLFVLCCSVYCLFCVVLCIVYV